jgi:ribosomal protein L19
LEAAQIHFLRSLLGFTQLGNLNKTDITKRIKVRNIVEDMCNYHKTVIKHIEILHKNGLPKAVLCYKFDGKGKRKFLLEDLKRLVLE